MNDPSPPGRDGRRAAGCKCRVFFSASRGTNGELPLRYPNGEAFTSDGLGDGQERPEIFLRADQRLPIRLHIMADR
ncbi:MAG TPA: hypothetical protein G4O11_00960 [Anaerolineae bacterium]|nr:hypothetical protein [Anaerolineae bacterium]